MDILCSIWTASRAHRGSRRDSNTVLSVISALLHCGDIRAGAGYSGGGGKNGGRGGSNGEDGEDGDQRAGGHGSGLEIGLLSTENFRLTPGDGGQAYLDGTGGGGGGVIVNGKMPGDSLTGGKGYGEGGSLDDGDVMHGYPGCVLLEK